MKAKTIKALLKKKHNEFVQSIKDETVRELVRTNSIITGGSIVSMLLDEEVNDYDYYFANKETVIAVAQYYVKEFNATHDCNAVVKIEDGRVSVFIQSNGVAGEMEGHEVEVEDVTEEIKPSTDEEKPKYRPVFLSTNAISLSNKVQLVIRFYGDAAEIHSNYDFAHATCYWNSKTGHLELPARALEAIITRELVYTGSKYPLASIVRTRKFIKRGWNINAGQYLKMALQLNELDLLDMEVLREQLTGVDAAYFYQVIDSVKKQKAENPDFKIDSMYLIEVINRIF